MPLRLSLFLWSILWFCTNCSSSKDSSATELAVLEIMKDSRTAAEPVPPPPPTGVAFTPSVRLMPLLEQAGQEGKLVFIDFYADWCLPCKLMDEDVFLHEETATLMNDHFINYKVDGEKGHGTNLVALFEVKVYPTLLFMDEKGRILLRKEGAAYPTELQSLAREAMAIKAAQTQGDQ